MNLAGLDFENIPPFSVPTRFFIVATIFGIVSALVIAVAGEDLWLSRWHPATLALTHSLVIGLISTTICGALLQLLPVLGGKSLPKVKLIAGVTLFGLSVGTLLLMTAFFFSEVSLFKPALLFLSLVFSGFLGIILWLIKQRSNDNVSINTMRLGFFAMLVVVIIACLMLADYFLGTQFNLAKQLTDNHAGWGLIGWVSLMIIGVSFQVLPMFHVAPAFPHWCTKYLPVILFSLLVADLLLSSPITAVLIKITLAIYALTALRCLYLRKRKISDTSVTCWQIALTVLAASSLFSLIPDSYLLLTRLGLSPLTLAALFIFGWVISVIMAMLIKIVPFLAYLHLQRLCGYHVAAFSLLPNVHQLLSKSRMQWLLYCHCATMISLLCTLFLPQSYPLLALVMFVQFGYLLYLIFQITRSYGRIATEINAAIHQS